MIGEFPDHLFVARDLNDLRLFADVVETDNVGGIAEVMREAREARQQLREKREAETIEHE